MGSKSQRFGSSLWREDGFRETRVGGSEVTALRQEIGFRESCGGGIKVTVFWWLAWVRSRFSGVLCWWERGHSVLAKAQRVRCFWQWREGGIS